MGLRVEWVGYGRPGAEALRATIAAAKADEPLAPVTVVVPSNHVGVASRRLLASGALGPTCGRGAGLAAVTFLTPYRLADLLGAPCLAAAGRRPVSTPVLAAALRSALATGPGLFAPVAGHPATEAALVAAYRELRDLSAGALEALAARSERAGDVVRLHREVRARLEAAWYDEEDLMVAASGALAAGGGIAGALGAVVVYLPQRLSRHSAALIAATAERAEVDVIAGATGARDADAEVVSSLARLGIDALPSPGPGPGQVFAPGRTRLVSASDSDDEVRAAVRAVVDAVRAGTPLDRIAILHASPDPYARLVHEHLAAAGIAANGAAVVPVASRVAGRALLELLALPDNGFRRQDLFAWLASAPVLDDGRWAPVAAWERLSRRAGVVAGRTDWDQLLARLADDLEARAAQDEGDPDAPAWRATSHRDDADRARRLRCFALGLVDELAIAAQVRPWAEHARWAGDLLRRTLGGERDRQAWPPVETKAAERVELALDRLAALDAVEGPVPLEVFTRTIALELEDDLGRVGRFGEGVLVGSVAMGVGLDLDLAVVVGLAEGSFPAPVGDDSLLPDRERHAAGGELALRRALVGRQHRALLAVLAGARCHLLGIPRGDLRASSTQVPSRWVLDIASQLAGRRIRPDDVNDLQEPWMVHVASFAAGLRNLASPATTQEHRLRSLLAGAPVADPVLTGGGELLAARHGDRFTRFDGNLGGLGVASPADAVTSPTRLERWAVCPFAYLVQHVLGVEVVENPEEALQITDLTKGSLVHEVLERFIVGVIDRPASERPAPGEPWPAAERARLAAIGDEVCGDYQARGLTGRPIFWQRDRARVLADLERFLDVDDSHRLLHATRPLAAEMAFGFSWSELDAVPLHLPDGRAVRFRGRADRLDVGTDGTVHVVDYKTGGSKGYEKLCQDDPDLRGTKLQLAVYGAAAHRHCGAPGLVRSEYWFVSSKGGFVRAGYPVTVEVLDHVGRTLATMVNGIEAGVFPPHPTATTTSWRVGCEACDPDGLGVAELRRAWERKRTDPAVAAYADLAEPQEPQEPDAGPDFRLDVEEVGSA